MKKRGKGFFEEGKRGACEEVILNIFTNFK